MKKLIEFILSLFRKKPEPVKPIPIPSNLPLGELTRGFTLEDVSNLPAIIKAIKAMPFKPTVRIVFHYPDEPREYVEAVTEIAKVATIVGQPCDSEYSKKMSIDQYEKRFKTYIEFFSKSIDIWETGNEFSGDWLSKDIIKQVEIATFHVKVWGKKTLNTLYWNTETCKDSNGIWYNWAEHNLTKFIKDNTDYASLSIYGQDCDGNEPTYEQLDMEFATLKHFFPNSRLCISEYGKQGDTARMRHYLNYPKTGFGGYWHGSKDLLDINGKMFAEFVR